jgi:hypothetical protein
MRRLALFAAAVLAVSAAPPARAESLDVDLTRLGPPDPTVWTTILNANGGSFLPGDPVPRQYALESLQRFATLSTQLALALSSPVLQTAATTGYSGFALDLEVGYADVKADPVGTSTTVKALGFTNNVWPTSSTQPSSLLIPAIHVRKALPYSFEVGGRLLWVNGSSYYAAQGEAKWALNEGFEYIPDIAVRAAFTRLLGVKDWNLSSTDLDFIISMRLAAAGVVSFTPYFAARYTLVNASSGAMDFAPCRPGPATATTCTVATTPADLASTTSSFPLFTAGFYRSTLGLRFTTYALSLAVEGTFFGGATASSGDYKDVKIPSSVSGAAKLGWEF